MAVENIRERLDELTAFHCLRNTMVMLHYAGGGASGVAAMFEAGFDSPAEWLHDALRYTKNPYGTAVSRGELRPNLAQAAAADIALLAEVFDCDIDFAALTEFYRTHGCGPLARYQALRWEGEVLWGWENLVGIARPDSAQEDELLGYQWQRDEVIANTRALLEGRPHHNVLLYGDSGTGKSATVKHLLNVSGFERLRLIEADKQSLLRLPKLLRELEAEPFSFVVFIDDLAFDQDDSTYSALKSTLEGGLERRPDNVAIYATSNRRNLVRQTVSERTVDDVDRQETIAEKTALTERFGLRIAYMTLSRREYLQTVEHLADFAGIDMERNLLHSEAIKFEALHPGKTPRTAKQFVASLMVAGQP